MAKPVLGALANIETTIRRFFAITGPIGTEFTSECKPVALAADLTMPGYSAFRGRRFGFATTTNLGGAAACSVIIKCDAAEGVIIERIGMRAQGTASILNNIRYCSSDIAAPYATAARATWIDQGTVSTDAAPVSTNSTIQVDSTLGAPIWMDFSLNSAEPVEVNYPIHLPLKAFLILRWGGVIANTGFYFFGRVA